MVPLKISFENAMWMYGQILMSANSKGKDTALLGLRREGRRMDQIANAIMELAEIYGAGGDAAQAIDTFLGAIRQANADANG